MKGHMFSKTAITCASMVALAQPVFATVTNRACAGATVPTGRCIYNNGVPASLWDIYTNITPQGATVRTEASAYSSLGVLKASASSRTETFTGTRNFSDGRAGADATWGDNILVTGGPRGTRGYFTATMLLLGSASAFVEGVTHPGRIGTAGVGFELSGTGFAPIRFSNGLLAGGTIGQADFNRLVDVQINFVYGFTTPISAFLRVDARSGAYTHWIDEGVLSGATTSFGNSVYWGGITGVFDQSGAPRLEYSAIGETGFDYSQSLIPSVPEPATWAMLIAGFGLVGGAARRRRSAVAS